jgi:hypothetical protein
LIIVLDFNQVKSEAQGSIVIYCFAERESVHNSNAFPREGSHLCLQDQKRPGRSTRFAKAL